MRRNTAPSTTGARAPTHAAWRSSGSWLRAAASRAVVNQSWDQLLYCCGGAAVMSLAIWWVFPGAAELAAFAWLMFFTSGPASTFLPSASEPILMAFGKLYSPLLLAAIGVAAIALVEWVNYRVFGAVLLARRLDRVRSARLTHSVMAWFDLQPFATVVIAAFTPVPFWVARCCAVISLYPMPRFIAATALGRFPRIWLIATVGTLLPFTSSAILAGGGVVILGAGAAAAIGRRRRRSVNATEPATGAGTTTSTIPHHGGDRPCCSPC
ncbi:MAG: VTT domain-containing protein [Gemmatimonadota bacterium]|nr:VTT domain-containing protein [Gemmatimonadota bacterium]